ncbi:universal stress protein [Yinghuangia seranimata]|uniref:universal stress protein n=1 Tax=Yinghuangia seranimata TaxID=408067 RepID=UPI00248B5118|nr:universal stress protein [Yinghuangia seranimata]MDI2125457.1 universal stress protein [Yinghuangia seranimata]
MTSQTAGRPHITVGVDGSAHADTALRWAAQEAGARGLALRIVHCHLPLPIPGGRLIADAEARNLLQHAEITARAMTPAVDVTTVDATDVVGAALAAESETAAMLVVGSRGRGGFRSLLLGSSSLTTAAVARCPVVVVREERAGEDQPRDVVLGMDLRDTAETVVRFAFEAAAARPGARLRVVHSWTRTGSLLEGGPVLDEAAIEDTVTRELAEATAGWAEKYPQVPVLRTVTHDTAAAALVEASAHAALTVVGRRTSGTSLGLHLGTAAHATLLHAHGAIAVVPF